MVTYLDFIDHVEGICEARVREDYLVQGIRQAVWCHFAVAEGVFEICQRVANSSMATKHHKPSNGDENKR